MHTAFISYSSKDQQKAIGIYKLLERNGIPCWIAPDCIPIGSNYTNAIPAAIGSCPIFLVLLTENAQKSRFVLKELEFAVSSGKLIIPVLLEDFPLNDEFRFLVGVEHHLAAFQMSEEAIVQALVPRIRNTDGKTSTPVSKGTQPQSSTAALTIVRKVQYSGCATPISIGFEDGTIHKIRVNGTFTQSMPVGEHCITFSFWKKKTTVKISLTKAATLRISLHSLNGNILVDTLTPTQMTIIESK